MKKLLSAATICCLTMGLSLPAAQALDTATHQMKGQLVRSSNLVGADLQNKQGDDIGQINDIVFDENTGGKTHAVLAAGGYIGIGDKLTPVKWDQIQVQVNKDKEVKVRTNLDKSALASMKSYDQSDWSDHGTDVLAKMPDAGNAKLVRASKVNGAKLFDTNGQQIGAIKDVVLDVMTGKAAYAVVSFEDSYIKKGDEMTMVPWKLVRQSKKATPGYVLHADKAKLENAKFFGPNNWPDMHDMSWNKQTYDYYAVSPYYWSGV